jgi:hypothetical protein
VAVIPFFDYGELRGKGRARMSVFEIGRPFPGALKGDGLVTFMEPSEGEDNGIDAMIVASMSRPLPREIEAFIRKPIRLGILSFDPILFILVVADGQMVWDSPFGIGLYARETATKLVAASRQARGWPAMTRRLTHLLVVDQDNMLIKGIRAMTLTCQWWITLADELERCPLSLSREDYRAAMQQAYSRWKSPAEMIPHCAIIEEAGI